MVLHSCCDGLSIGISLLAMSTNERMDLVLIALLLHKVSETFGYGSFLHNKGASGRTFFYYLCLFTGSCPLFALLTYLIADSILSSNKENMMLAVAILLIFSAGSLIYVSTVHVLAEIFENHDHFDSSC